MHEPFPFPLRFPGPANSLKWICLNGTRSRLTIRMVAPVGAMVGAGLALQDQASTLGWQHRDLGRYGTAGGRCRKATAVKMYVGGKTDLSSKWNGKNSSGNGDEWAGLCLSTCKKQAAGSHVGEAYVQQAEWKLTRGNGCC